MVVSEIQEILERWAPPAVAWERDNVGLQVGSPRLRVRKIVVCLDVTMGVVREAIRASANLIVSHHPLLFRPARRIITDRGEGAMIDALLRARIAVYSMHTNLDFAGTGVSYALARALNLGEIEILQPLDGQYQKVAVFAPHTHADRVLQAMAAEGAGKIGDYHGCSFSTEGVGTFTPGQKAQPFIGTRGKAERVRESRIEMIVQRWRTPRVLAAMRKAHPYEEVAYDVYDLANPSPEFGAGAIGILGRPVQLRRFLRTVRRQLRSGSIRFAGDPAATVRRVAVCGGSGTEYLPAAVRAGADVYVTADIRYHTFQEFRDSIAIVDAGHYETEAPVIPHIVERLRRDATVRRAGITVRPCARPTNFISYT